jgi:hypothetical protein
MSDILQLLSTALTILGVLAFATSVIVQTIKDIPELKEFPTQLVTLFVAEIITTMSLFAGCAYYSIHVLWYYIFGAFITGFFVFTIATGGWDKLNDIWQRTKFNGKQ